MERRLLGTILAGSLSEGLVMRLDGRYPLEEVKTGKFVSICGSRYTFFSMITDLELEVSNQDILLFPPTQDEVLLKEILQQQDIYAKATVRPMLMLDEHKRAMPVKTIPSHFTLVYEAHEKDLAHIFGNERENKRYFTIGTPLDMDVSICINLDLFTERSNAVFGKTGTGKTFITRLILAGLVKSEKAVNLIFDMHSEYGHQARKEGEGLIFVKGLKTLFPSKVAIFSLDPESTRRRGCAPDFDVILGYQDIRVDDVMSLQDELNLHSTAIEAAYLIASKYKRNWLKELLSQEGTIKEFAESIGAHPESIGALYRKLKRLERFPFLREVQGATTVIDRLIEYLDKGIHVILEFGTYSSMLCYLLVANIITRRIHEHYIAKTEKYLASGAADDEPRKLMITIEEAHKFLNPTTARQTIFGVIAREMRKYYVSLLVVDQRPSGIDAEILSQIGTKVVALLNDEKDIQAVLTGVSNASGLRTVLATLDTKQQAVALGHAVPMPVVVKTRAYDEEFYKAMGQLCGIDSAAKVIDEIF